MTMPWFRDPRAWALIARGYLPWLAGLNLAWEALQLPLYTIWTEAPADRIAFAIAHCTLGDALIGALALVLALILGREGAVAQWRWRRVVGFVLVIGTGYTFLSEWLNTTLERWNYSPLMPTLKIAGGEIGVSPLLQWLILPPLALFLARRAQPDSR